MIIRQNANDGFHFAANLRNVNDLKCALALLESRQDATKWNTEEHQALYSLYEATFHHHQFTGRSGTFFAYEGLGSIYWHMVSKLALAVQENYTFAQSIGDSVSATELLYHYRKIRDGLGVDKSPDEYGAFPTDPYSHTPKHARVQQPGMTGQVKEDILCQVFYRLLTLTTKLPKSPLPKANLDSRFARFPLSIVLENRIKSLSHSKMASRKPFKATSCLALNPPTSFLETGIFPKSCFVWPTKARHLSQTESIECFTSSTDPSD